MRYAVTVQGLMFYCSKNITLILASVLLCYKYMSLLQSSKLVTS